MKKAKWLFFVCWLLAAIAGCAETAPMPEEGLYTIGVQSSSRMFNITKCVLQVRDGQMTAVITLSGDGYGYVYAGTAQEAADAPLDTWIPYVEDWGGAYTYALPIRALDEGIAVAAHSKRYEKWYDRSLKFFSNTLSPYQEIAPDGVYSAEIISNMEINGADCLLYSDEGKMILKARDLTMELISLDTRIPIEGGWIKVELPSLKPYRVTAPDGVYSAQVQTDSALLRFADCCLTITDGEITALLTAKNNNFDYIYMGRAADANVDTDGWIPAIPDENGANTYEIHIESLDNTIPCNLFSQEKTLV